MKIETVFQIAAVVLAGATAYFLYTGHREGAFVSAVLGCVAFLLSLRFQVKARIATRDKEHEAAEASKPSDS